MARKASRTANRREHTVDTVQQRTLNLALTLAPEQRQALEDTAILYNRMWGEIVAWCDTNHTVNRTRIQKHLYHMLRDRYPQLPSQFVCIAQRDAAGAVASWNGNHPKRKWNLKAVRRRLTINYDLRVMSLRGRLLTLSVRHDMKRLRIMLPDQPQWFKERYPDATLNAAKLVLKTDGTARISLIYRLADTLQPAEGDVLGVDLGQHSLTMDSKGGETRYTHVQGVRRRYAHNRLTLQKKGTRSAHRRMRTMKEREKRFIRDVNHQASKHLAATPDIKAIAFEDLAYIRHQATRDTKTGRKRRNMLNQWPFAQLQEFTAYKAARRGIAVIMVDPRYTSQTCNRCGYVDARNRDHARFDCRRCGHSDNADHNAALNIRDRALERLHIHG
ncbi:RNA-guided endonuclease InsQ/TnpB family protein [Bifidobacterium boum]|uniref:RNA-guided endonuclease InsQ/TnpB family protein n=1 Tax=Bifidobacterium TaxID=1678 RepID=UPI0039920B7E